MHFNSLHFFFISHTHHLHTLLFLLPRSYSFIDILFKMASIASHPSSMAKTTSEPNRNKKYDPKKPHITEEPITKANWYKHVNWLNITLIVGVPIYGLIMAYWTPLQWKTAVWAVLYYFMTGLGITAGKSQSISMQFILHLLIPFTRLPQTLGTFLILRHPPIEDFPCSRWRWCRRRFH